MTDILITLLGILLALDLVFIYYQAGMMGLLK